MDSLDPTALQAIALAAAEERSVDGSFKRIVDGLAAHSGVALARIWLVGPSSGCEVCRRRGLTPESSTLSLHLVASNGTSLDGKPAWQRTDGDFHLVKLGEAKIGQIALAGGPVLLTGETVAGSGWLRRPDWFKTEAMTAFVGHPLRLHGSVLGVLGIFSRKTVAEADLRHFMVLADQASVVFVNSRAFEQVESHNRLLLTENAYLREEIDAFAGSAMIGSSAALREAVEQAELVAVTEATVLIEGESGTGKELFARHIHGRSGRRERPLIKVNCGSIPHELFESEFFGHVKGAFTGATRDRQGRFQLADGGTLFLDELGEIPVLLQAKLLRALQEGEFERVGDEKTVRVDVRLLAATNRELRRAVSAGTFREDLYYRLSVFPIRVPPLRDRVEDIPTLARHFAARARRTIGRPDFRLSERDLEALCRHRWPGNVRELINLIERAAILSQDGRTIEVRSLLPASEPLAVPSPNVAVSALPDSFVPMSVWEAREKQNLLAAVERANWKLAGAGGAAELLGMKPTTLASRLRALGITRPQRTQRKS